MSRGILVGDGGSGLVRPASRKMRCRAESSSFSTLTGFCRINLLRIASVVRSSASASARCMPVSPPSSAVASIAPPRARSQQPRRRRRPVPGGQGKRPTSAAVVKPVIDFSAHSSKVPRPSFFFFVLCDTMGKAEISITSHTKEEVCVQGCSRDRRRMGERAQQVVFR